MLLLFRPYLPVILDRAKRGRESSGTRASAAPHAQATGGGAARNRARVAAAPPVFWGCEVALARDSLDSRAPRKNDREARAEANSKNKSGLLENSRKLPWLRSRISV
jgi:hypothetical protein